MVVTCVCLPQAARAQLAASKGESALEPYNISYVMAGGRECVWGGPVPGAAKALGRSISLHRHAGCSQLPGGSALQAACLHNPLHALRSLMPAQHARPRCSSRTHTACHNSKPPARVPAFPPGDTARAMDPYFPFEDAVDVWGRTFAALGIHYKGSVMRLDLLDRVGKYSNGFCHWPQPAWRKSDGSWVPAVTNFTSLASPDQVGCWGGVVELVVAGG